MMRTKKAKRVTKRKCRRPHVYSTGPVGGTMTKFRVIPATQCNSVDWLGHECQGVYGHDGEHWCYRPDGSLDHWKRKKDIKSKWDVAHSHTPPCHKTYVHPKDMQPFANFDRREIIGTFEDKEPVDPAVMRSIRSYEKHAKKAKRKKSP